MLTNTHGSKTDLSDYSANILTAPSTVDGLLEGLARLLALWPTTPERSANLRRRRASSATGHAAWPRSSTGSTCVDARSPR